MPVGIGPERLAVPYLRFDVMVIIFAHAIRPDHFGQFLQDMHHRNPVSLQMKPSRIVRGYFVEAVGIGEGYISFGENLQRDPDLIGVFIFQIVRPDRRFARMT